MKKDAIDAAARREMLTWQLCQAMGWEYKTCPVWTGLRKAALAEAVVIGVEKLQEILVRLTAREFEDVLASIDRFERADSGEVEEDEYRRLLRRYAELRRLGHGPQPFEA